MGVGGESAWGKLGHQTHKKERQAAQGREIV